MPILKSVITKSLLATTALVFAGSGALAGTDTDPQAITATVAGACTVVVPDVDFGAVTGTAKVTVTFDVTVACTVKPIITSGTLSAGPGGHFDGTTRNIEGAVGAPKPLMSYEIYVGSTDAGPVIGTGVLHPEPTITVVLSEITPTVTGFAAVLAASGGPRPEGSFSDTVNWILTF